MNPYRANQFCCKLKKLHDSLLNQLPSFIAFVFNKSGVHWAPCIVSMEEHVIRQGDSLGWGGDQDLLAKLRWFLWDVAEVQGEWTEVPLVVPHQGSGSGSCGVVALSVIESFLAEVPSWTKELALAIHMGWLGDFLHHHFCLEVS